MVIRKMLILLWMAFIVYCIFLLLQKFSLGHIYIFLFHCKCELYNEYRYFVFGWTITYLSIVKKRFLVYFLFSFVWCSINNNICNNERHIANKLLRIKDCMIFKFQYWKWIVMAILLLSEKIMKIKCNTSLLYWMWFYKMLKSMLENNYFTIIT